MINLHPVAPTPAPEPTFGVGPHIGLGMTRALAAFPEHVERWPSLVVEVDGASVQIDVHSGLSGAAARGVVAVLAAGVAEWAAAVEAADRPDAS